MAAVVVVAVLCSTAGGLSGVLLGAGDAGFHWLPTGSFFMVYFGQGGCSITLVDLVGCQLWTHHEVAK